MSLPDALSSETGFAEQTDWYPDLSRLISELVEKRKEKRISQTELAGMTGMPQPGIARLEKAARPMSSMRSGAPNLGTVLRVAHALGYTLTLVPLETLRPEDLVKRVEGA